MSLDRRLKEGLERSSSGVEGREVDTVLTGLIKRARRRQRVRRAVAATVVLAISLAAMLLAPKALDWLRGDGRVPAAPGGVSVITTMAGSSNLDVSTGDGGPAIEAQLEYPVDVALDQQGNLYILEHGIPGKIRRVDPFGRITTFVGPGAAGEAGGVELNGATGLAIDTEGNVYVAAGQTQVLRVAPSGGVTIVAGTGEPGFSGDSGPATEAKLRTVWDMDVDAGGDLYISGGNRVRKVDASGVITTLAGTGSSGYSGDGGPAVDAQLGGPTGVAVDAVGNVYLIDYRSDRIRRIDLQRIITTIGGPGPGRACIASGDGGPATEADFCAPEHLALDTQGNIYFADTGTNRIRRIDPAGIITTVAGTGTKGFGGDGGPPTKALLSEPSSVTIGPDGALYIADSGNYRIRRLTP